MTTSENAEKEGDDLYRKMVERTPVVMAIIQDGRFCYANPATATLMGHSLDDLYQMDFLDIVSTEHKARAAELCEKLITNTSMKSRDEIHILGKNRRIVPLDIIFSAITVENKPAIQLIGWDHSDYRKQNERLLHSEKLAAFGRFVSTVAHELNNPLTVIVGFSEILLSNLPLDGQDKADLQMVASEADRARQMVHELLTLSRIPLLQTQSVHLNQLLAAIINDPQTSLQNNQITFTTEFDPGLPPVQADPHYLRHALTQLITYIHKSLQGQENKLLRVKTMLKNEASAEQIVQIILAYNGPQRSLNDLRQIFEPTYTSREDGHGLGLAITYKLIEQHGGCISFTTEPGEGVQFLIELPGQGELQK